MKNYNMLDFQKYLRVMTGDTGQLLYVVTCDEDGNLVDRDKGYIDLATEYKAGVRSRAVAVKELMNIYLCVFGDDKAVDDWQIQGM